MAYITTNSYTIAAFQYIRGSFISCEPEDANIWRVTQISDPDTYQDVDSLHSAIALIELLEK